MSLTAKHELFCQEYLIDCNATKAAIRVGYSPDNAASHGSDLLMRSDVKERVEFLMEQRCQRTEITQDMVVRGLHAIATGAEKDSDKVNAWELLGKHIHMFKEELNVNIELARKAEGYAKLPIEEQIKLMKQELIRLEGKT